MWNQDSLWYGVRVVQTTLQALFLSTITGVVVQGFRSCSVPVIYAGYLVKSRRPLWFRSLQANHPVFNTLSQHSLLAAVSCSHVVGGPRVPPDQLSPRTCGPRTSCPPGRVVLGPNVPCQDRMSPHCKVPASLSSDGKLGVGPENKAG